MVGVCISFDEVDRSGTCAPNRNAGAAVETAPAFLLSTTTRKGLCHMAAPAKPTALKLIGGRGPGQDSAGRKVVSVPSAREAPPMPKGLPREAQAEWKRVVPLLDKLRVLAGDLHRGVLVRYCTAWAEFHELRADVATQGRTEWVTVRNSAGDETTKRVVRPEVKMLAEARAEVHRLTGELGLSPATEAKAYASAQTTAAMGDGGAVNPFAYGATT
ncbi:hypothetical protein CH264_28150 [Rhodococcus sp. 06-1477-1A]|nr:hypothetical protein CH264_28150 [Rhodococcus sp. 06-1477-1A]